MTAQMPDTLLIENESYDIVRMSGEELITPEQFGMRPHFLHTACWRGYNNTYSIVQNSLFLLEMVVGSAVYLPINGIVATNGKYSNLHLRVSFTGGLLAGNEICVYSESQEP